jgi:hypothetical protein
MSVAFAMDVFVNDMKLKMVDTPKKIPGIKALLSTGQLISALRFRAMKYNTTGHITTR